jgi:hypothetical protein
MRDIISPMNKLNCNIYMPITEIQKPKINK